MTDAPSHRFVSAPDGLRLHYAQWGSTLDPGTPVVCLPGLARTTGHIGFLGHNSRVEFRNVRLRELP